MMQKSRERESKKPQYRDLKQLLEEFDSLYEEIAQLDFAYKKAIADAKQEINSLGGSAKVGTQIALFQVNEAIFQQQYPLKYKLDNLVKNELSPYIAKIEEILEAKKAGRLKIAPELYENAVALGQRLIAYYRKKQDGGKLQHCLDIFQEYQEQSSVRAGDQLTQRQPPDEPHPLSSNTNVFSVVSSSPQPREVDSVVVPQPEESKPRLSVKEKLQFAPLIQQFSAFNDPLKGKDDAQVKVSPHSTELGIEMTTFSSSLRTIK